MTEPDVIRRLSQGLSELAPRMVATPAADRLGAALIIVEPDGGSSDTTIVYTRRRDDLRSHPGQISFPGGRVDPGESVEEAAVREAHEEVALEPRAVELIGRLPAFYIPPSRFWLQAVVAHWIRPHSLTAAEAEVAAVLHVPLSLLTDPASWRAVQLGSVGWSWAWDLGDGHVLWGATGVLTAVLLGLLDPGWSGGVLPKDLTDREVRPWEGERRVAEKPLPARLSGAGEAPADTLVVQRPATVTPERVAAAAALVAEAARQVADGGRRVIVLAGPGGTGAIGHAAAERLRDDGLDATLLTPGEGVEVAAADVVIDAVIGRGLRGPLRGAQLQLVHALRLREQPVVSVDLPSGVDPTRGIVGDAVAADVTIAIDGAQPGLLLPGLAPFVGDLYVAAVDPRPRLVRAVNADAAPTWRE